MMQQSPYSVYDEYFQSDLETVYAKCGGSGETDAPPSLDSPPEFPPDPICVSGKTHITSAGDTCDSIALKYSISSAALVMSNSRYLISCDNLKPDMELCLPESCSSVYTMQNSDTCRSIELTNSYPLGTIRKYNSWVSWDCSNLQSSVDAYGRVLCIGVQGATFTATAPVPGVTLAPGDRTGYSPIAVDPPSNATVADGTTLECGRWHVAKEDESCAMICLQEGLTSTLFLQVNPSLEGNHCSASLKPGVAYCVSVTSNWNDDGHDEDDGDYTSTLTDTTASRTATTTTSSDNGISTPTPTQSGMVRTCKDFYLVVPGDGCYDLAASAGITLDDFYAWNPAVGSDCGGLWPDYYVCISAS